jgi:hypothetical protein
LLAFLSIITRIVNPQQWHQKCLLVFLTSQINPQTHGTPL